MVVSESVLELRNIFHSGQVEPTSWTQRLFGNAETGLILKDITLEVKSGEVFAILGSKGSGKRALLDVISRRAHGATRGQIIFEGNPLTQSLFQRTCGYVTHRTDLIPSLTTEQTLYYAANLSSGEKVSRYTCSTRVRQMLGDLALNQVSHHSVASLNTSQYRRLTIGVQLIKEPILLLLDEPTAGLDPLSTYLVVSILSSYARRRCRSVMLTMEKPRSDVFPFLDRAAFLCLGDILYAGPTRLMLDYFTSIGFPCPTMENPLMYYLCLSTVDRRSRERFLESNSQVLELVEKFKNEGGAYISTGGPVQSQVAKPSVQLRPSRPSVFQVSITLYQRLLAATFNITPFGLSHMFLRLLLFPLYALLVFILYLNTQNWEHIPINRNGLLLFSVLGAYFMSTISTAYTFGIYRTRYYQEAHEGIYSGPLFLICYFLFSIPFSLASVAAASRIIFQASGLTSVDDWLTIWAILWGCHLLAEQQTIALLMVINSKFTTVLTSFYLCLLYILLGSGTLRSYGGLPEWLLYTSYATQPHSAGTALSLKLFGPPLANCSETQFGCRHTENFGLAERSGSVGGAAVAAGWDVAMCLGLPGVVALANILIYVMPLPAFVKAKFRD
uniref:Putative transporter abc superfamily breast cancer resistance protein n=1 Tax=Triatoma infestans TaxID=30076 RepID=A0A023F328_TRIIF